MSSHVAGVSAVPIQHEVKMSNPLSVRPPLRIETVESERLILTPLDVDADAVDLHAMKSDPEVFVFGGTSPSTRIETTRRRLQKELRNNGNTTWVIRLRDDPRALGTIGVFGDQGTTIRGIGWSLRRSHWGLGITSEAALLAVPYLLAQPGVDGLEAWVDSRNTRSLGVARRAGMDERGRLPRTSRDGVGQTIVMARAASPEDPYVFGITTTLQVRDVPAMVTFFETALRLHLAWSVGEPATLARLAIAPWSGSPGFHLRHSTSPDPVVELSIEVGVPVETVLGRVEAAGLDAVAMPETTPWHRREFSFRLPDGHIIHISGPVPPAS
jgi:RimJ/RimL family protein N-acetyltransferase/catechol 2,3-dioxygenase-like lactoylglutathione lyase family enzyme